MERYLALSGVVRRLFAYSATEPPRYSQLALYWPRVRMPLEVTGLFRSTEQTLRGVNETDFNQMCRYGSSFNIGVHIYVLWNSLREALTLCEALDLIHAFTNTMDCQYYLWTHILT